MNRIGYGAVFLAMAAFFVYILIQMAESAGSMQRLFILGVTTVGVIVASAVIYFLLRAAEQREDDHTTSH